MDVTRAGRRTMEAGRRIYGRMPQQYRTLVGTQVRRRLGDTVTLRRVSFTQRAQAGFRPALAPFQIVAPEDLFIPKALVKRGLVGYEPHALECYLAVLDHTRGPVLDIGANVGLYGLLASAHGRRPVWSFEPTPRIAATARRSARSSGLPLRVVEAAMGESSGPVEFYLSTTSDASNSLNPAFRPGSERIEVPGGTVDEFCRRHRLAPGLLKIDTESTEAAVLRGARRTIERHRPYLLVEVLPGRRPGELDAAVAGLDYTPYHLDRDGYIAPAESIVGKPGGDDMYLLSPRPLRATFWRHVSAWRAALPSVEIGHDTVDVPRRLLEPALRPAD